MSETINSLNAVHKQSDRDAYNTLTKFFGMLQGIRLDYEPLWSDVIENLAYDRYNFLQNKQHGAKSNTLIYDGSPLSAWRILVNGTEGNLLSQSGKWIELSLPNIVRFPGTSPLRKYNGRLDEIPEVKEYLEQKEEGLYSAFRKSNFYSESNSMIRDASSIGTANLFAEEDIGGRRINFSCNNPGEVWIAENRFGVVDTVFRKFKLRANVAAQMWDSRNFCPELAQAIQNNPMNEFEFNHACFPRDDVEMYFSNDGKWKPKPGSNNKPWASIYWQTGYTERILDRKGFRFNPFIVWRWQKNSEESYGRSPGIDAIVDIMKLNVMEKSQLAAAQLAVEPPMMVHKAFKGQLNLKPRGRNYFSKEDEKIFPIQKGIEWTVGQWHTDRAQKIIEGHFFTEFFIMLYNAAINGAQLSVPQVLEMQGEKASLMTSIVGRIIGEFLKPSVDVVDAIETDAGRMPDPPQILIDFFKGADIDVDFLGTLAQAQKRMTKMQGINQGIGSIEALLKVNPEAADIIDADEAAREILHTMGFPAKATRTRDEVAQLRKIRAEEMKAAKQQEMMEKAAMYAPGLAKSVEPNSPLENIGKLINGQTAGNA